MDKNLFNVAVRFIKEEDGKTYVYAMVDGELYKTFAYNNPMYSEGFPIDNTPENRKEFESWIKRCWDKVD